MKTLALAAALALAAPAAHAGSWTSKWTGPHGGVYEGGGDCDNGACKAAGTFTGPFGGVWKHARDRAQDGGRLGRRRRGHRPERPDFPSPMDLERRRAADLSSGGRGGASTSATAPSSA